MLSVGSGVLRRCLGPGEVIVLRISLGVRSEARVCCPAWWRVVVCVSWGCCRGGVLRFI